ncbi:hypothetical protein [Vulcanisaeta sp. JCM 16159]|nr:hypothetical protein [Vulcanisaeta sp. JCM 16159]
MPTRPAPVISWEPSRGTVAALLEALKGIAEGDVQALTKNPRLRRLA